MADRVCGKCKKEKLLEEFARCRAHGLQRWCVACMKEYKRGYKPKPRAKSEKQKSLSVIKKDFRHTQTYKRALGAGVCVRCGKADGVGVWFLNGNPMDMADDNLAAMCRKCGSQMVMKRYYGKNG